MGGLAIDSGIYLVPFLLDAFSLGQLGRSGKFSVRLSDSGAVNFSLS